MREGHYFADSNHLSELHLDNLIQLKSSLDKLLTP